MSESIVQSLIPATFRGVPFIVEGMVSRVARRTAIHEYPYREAIWAEDMGGGVNVFAFSGFFADNAGGLLAMLARDAFLLAAKQKGPGLLTHPTLGVMQVSVLSFASSEDKDHLGRFGLELEVCETATGPEFPADAGGAGSISLASLNVLSAGGSDYAAAALRYAGLGAGVLMVAPGVLRAWSALPASLSTTAESVMGAVAGLGDGWGRYTDGNAATAAPAGSTPQSLIAETLAAQADMQATVAMSLDTAADGTPVKVSAAAEAISGAILASAADPADQIRLLAPMAGYAATGTSAGGTLGDGIVAIEAAAAALCRTVTLARLAAAVAAYRLASYEEAIALRQQVADLFNAELLAASADARDASFSALRDLRSAVLDYLGGLAATLPATEVVVLPAPVPALAVAQLLYNDASRTGEIIARADPPHPAFMPTMFTALAA